MICYAVIDTNVLVSALLSSKDDTATVQVFCKVITGEIIPVYSNICTLCINSFDSATAGTNFSWKSITSAAVSSLTIFILLHHQCNRTVIRPHDIRQNLRILKSVFQAF